MRVCRRRLNNQHQLNDFSGFHLPALVDIQVILYFGIAPVGQVFGVIVNLEILGGWFPVDVGLLTV